MNFAVVGLCTGLVPYNFGVFFSCGHCIEHCYVFQLFQLTTLFLHGPLDDIPKFTVGLDRITINHRSVESTIARVQSYVREPSFIHRDFVLDKCFGMLRSVVTACDESSYEPIANVLLDFMGLFLSTWTRPKMLLLCGGEIPAVHPRGGLKCAVRNHLRSERHHVGLLLEKMLWLRLGW